MNKLFFVINLMSLFILIPNSFAQNTPPKLRVGQTVGFTTRIIIPEKQAIYSECRVLKYAHRDDYDDSKIPAACKNITEEVFQLGVVRGFETNPYDDSKLGVRIRTPNCSGNIDPKCGEWLYRENVAIAAKGTCYRGKCVGALVAIGDKDTFGKIIGIYENGDFQIVNNRNFSRVTLSDLQMAVSGLIKAHDSINSDLAHYFISPELRPEPKINDSLRGFLKVDEVHVSKEKSKSKNGEEVKGI